MLCVFFNAMYGMKKVEEKKYVFDSGESVFVRARLFSLESLNELKNTLTIFLPGWSMGVDDATVHILCSEFSDYTKTPTIAIETYANNSLTNKLIASDTKYDLLHEEALAISLYIKELGIKNVRVVGYSLGGDKAIHLVSILQNDINIKIEGLVLLDTVGLYTQKPLKLMVGFIKDLFVSFMKGFSRHSAVPTNVKNVGLQFATDMLWRWVHDVRRAGAKYPARLAHEVAEMTNRNPYMKEITVPVVLISGADDKISDLTQFSEKYGKTLFPQSKTVSLFTPKELGQHGLPFYRPAFVVRTSITALARTHKE
ncbi:hypothetical protein MNBD_CPR01-81 [hydrothermal vent metagenome]|uniref:AB hydrolase-1 domain-containing protein n=1 Tax=hydrothermal vent metagenome TaxID=652676 RepID=A0A3B0ULQ3_9ZZZZ